MADARRGGRATIHARRTLRTNVAVASALLLLPAAVSTRPEVAAAEADLAPGTLVLAPPGADTVSTLSQGAPRGTIGSGLSGPEGLAIDGAGRVYVADTGAHRVVRLTADGSQTVLADGLGEPAGLAVAESGNVFVTDAAAGRVLEITAHGSHVVANGFAHPVAVAVGRDEHLVVSDAGTNAVLDLAPDGSRTMIGSGYDDPRGVAVNPDGTVVVADRGNHRVVVVDPDGTQHVLTSAFPYPVAVAATGHGADYVATDHRIVRIAADGTRRTVADEGALALAAYIAPQSITITTAGPGGAAVGDTFAAAATGGDSQSPVTFSAEAASSGCTVSGDGAVAFTVVGTCLVDVDQAGDDAYRPAHAQLPIDVGRGAQALAFTSGSALNATVGTQYAALARGGGSGAPVTFSARDGTTACTVAPDGTVRFVHTGTCSVAAGQGGDADWNPAPTAEQHIAVRRGSQAVRFTSGVPGNPAAGGAYVPSMVATSGLAVHIAVRGPSTACTVDDAGVVTFAHAGSCTVVASQPGNPDWHPAAPAQQVFSIRRRRARGLFASSPPTDPVVGQTYTAVATGAGPVTFAADPASRGCAVASDGTVTLVAVGTCVVDAAGGSGQTDQQSFDIGPGPQVVTFTAAQPTAARVGQTYLVTATGADSGQPVTFNSDPTSSACAVSPGGLVQFTGAGACVIDADQAGTDDYEPAQRVQQSIAVSKGTQAIVFTSRHPAAPVVGDSYAVSATGGASGQPVQYAASADSQGNCTVTTAGVVHFTGVGACTVIATQAGSADYVSAPDVRQKMQVRLPQRVAITSTPDWEATVDGQYAVTANGGDSGEPVVLSVRPDSAEVCGKHGWTIGYRAPGTCTIEVAQAGTSEYAPARSEQIVDVYPRGLDPQGPIRHVVLLYQENHSFDETLGAYCQARATCDGYVGPVTLRDGTVAPMRHSPDIVPRVHHNVADQAAALDGGAMDGWASVRGCEPPGYACLTYYLPGDIPNLTALAGSFVVSDRTFSLADSPSWGGHVYAAAATLDGFTGEDPKPVQGVEPGPGWGCDSNRVADWVDPSGVVERQPSCIPAADGSGPFRPSPVRHVPTIFDALDAAQLSWKIYGAPRSAAPSSGPGAGYAWSICPTFADCIYTDQAKNLVRTRNVLTDAADGNLPAYSVITPSSSATVVMGTDVSQHNNQSMIAGDNWIARVVGAIENGPDWDSTAIFITYDDCGCFYDHVSPPANPDGTGQGVRVPMVIVSPYAKAGYTDSQDASLATVLAFAERSLGIAGMSVNDVAAYDYARSFDFDQAPRAGIALRQSRVPPSSFAWAAAHPDSDDPT